MNNSLCFTIKYSNIVNSLITSCALTGFIAPQNKITTDLFKYKVNCLWDTGATNSVISKEMATKMNLQPIGYKDVIGVNGLNKCKTYMISLLLPQGILAFPNIIVTEGSMDVDMLIGMDIIATGDFHISVHNKQTIFSFQYPASNPIDYTKKQIL